MSVRVQILSDLHLEIPLTLERCPALSEYKRDPDASILALLGDIGDPLPTQYRPQTYRTFIYEQAELFDYVLLIAGNHEYYHHTLPQANQAIEHVCREAPRNNVVFLNQSAFDYQGVRFLGCTLWVPMSGPPTSGTNDFKAIKQPNGSWITWEYTNQIHCEQQAWLQQQIEELRADAEHNADSQPRAVVVLTHHAPTACNTMHPDRRTPEAISGSCVLPNHTTNSHNKV
jgi:hypothetical protein